MVKIKGKIVMGKAQFENYMTEIIQGNETLIIPEENDTINEILRAAQIAISIVSPYARNCPSHHYHGRGCTYITIQPIYKEKRDDFIERIKELKASSAYISRDVDFDGRVQLLVCTPSPMDRPLKARDNFKENDFSKYGNY